MSTFRPVGEENGRAAPVQAMIGGMSDEGRTARGTRVLMVATKPPWPPVGGGNVVLDGLARGLHDAGAKVLVMSPAAPKGNGAPYPLVSGGGGPRSSMAVLPNLLVGRPLSLARWVMPEFGKAVLRRVETFRPDVVHLEQLQLAWLLPHLVDRVPVVLRQQNVEFLLLARYALLRPFPVRLVLRREARRMKKAEAEACRQAHVVAPISETDAAALARWVSGERLVVIPAALPKHDGPCTPMELEGNPAVVCLGSLDWGPNRDGGRWFVREVWPEVVKERPSAVLHLAGPGSLGFSGGPNIQTHGVVDDARALYAPGRIAVVPVRAGSGVRLRILEAWAEEVPVVSTPVGAEGLGEEEGDGVLVASGPGALAAAVVRLAGDEDLRRRLVAAGMRRLLDHSPEGAVAKALEAYRTAKAIRRSA